MLLELARRRRSTRRYRSKPIPPAKLARVLQAGRLAPSGANTQPWRFIVVDDPEIKRRIREGSEEADREFHREAPLWLQQWLREQKITAEKDFLTDSPVLIVVAGRTGMPYWLESTWIAIAYMILAAEEEGLGSLTYTPGDTSFLNALLGIPEGYKVVAVLPLGFPQEKTPLRGERMDLEAIAFHNRFGNKLKL